MENQLFIFKGKILVYYLRADPVTENFALRQWGCMTPCP